MTRLIPPLRKYRPIDAAIVAKAMINAAQSNQLNHFIIYAYGEVFELAENGK